VGTLADNQINNQKDQHQAGSDEANISESNGLKGSVDYNIFRTKEELKVRAQGKSQSHMPVLNGKL